MWVKERIILVQRTFCFIVSLHLARKYNEELDHGILLLVSLFVDFAQTDKNSKEEWRELVEDMDHAHPARQALQRKQDLLLCA